MSATFSPADLLLETARRGDLHHALILHGPSHETLASTAAAITKALNCLNATSGDGCVACSKIDRGIHPDVELIAVGEERKMIAVEQIRDLVSRASLRPYEGRYKIFIIDGAEAMSVGGANALLKTLEEPTSNTVFLLLTRSPDLLLPTIRSRCQQVALRAATGGGRRVVSGSLQMRRLAAMFAGSEVRDLQQSARDVTETLASYAESGAAASLLALAAIMSGREPASDALALFAAILRDLASLPPDDTELPEKAALIRERISPQALLAAADVAMRGVQRLVVNVDVRLLFERAVAELAPRN